MTATAADRARAERAAQGLGPTVTDPLVYRDLAVLLRPDRAQSEGTRLPASDHGTSSLDGRESAA